MAGKKEVLPLLRSFSLNKRSHELPFGEFISFVGRCIEQKGAKQPALRELATDMQLKVTTILEEFAEEERCELSYAEGKIDTIHFPEFYITLVRKQYRDIEEDAERPFPTEQSLGVAIPSDHITPIDVKKEFVSALEEKKFDEPQLVRLVYPEGITSIVVPSDLLDTGLMKLSLQRVRQYLAIQKNAFYMVSKLRSVFRTKEQVVKDMINNVLTQRQQAVDSLVNPTEFSFSFWTHLANAILKEFRDKTNKLEREQTFCHAAYLIGFYAVRYKSARRKQKDTALAFRTLERRLKGEPYVFTVSEISQFKDDQGIPLTNKYSRNELHAFIEKKTRPSGDEAIPEIVRLRTSDSREYFVAREVILPFTVKRTHDVSAACAKHYAEVFTQAIDQLKKLPEMKSDQAFLTSIEKKVRSDDPVFMTLLSYELLFLLLQEQKPAYEIQAEISRMLDTQHQKLIQMDELLRLSRRDLINQARMRLPFWKTVPVLNRIFGFLGRFAKGQRLTRAKRSSTAGSQASGAAGSRSGAGSDLPPSGSTKVLGGGSAGASGTGGSREGGKPGGPVALQRAMTKLKVEFIGNAGLQDAMSELIERWNPLYDPQAKADLVEDVNSLIRDFLRKLKRSFLVRPPDAQRIRTMAGSLASNKALDRIKRKEELTRYIELYMIKVLGGR